MYDKETAALARLAGVLAQGSPDPRFNIDTESISLDPPTDWGDGELSGPQLRVDITGPQLDCSIDAPLPTTDETIENDKLWWTFLENLVVKADIDPIDIFWEGNEDEDLYFEFTEFEPETPVSEFKLLRDALTKHFNIPNIRHTHIAIFDWQPQLPEKLDRVYALRYYLDVPLAPSEADEDLYKAFWADYERELKRACHLAGIDVNSLRFSYAPTRADSSQFSVQAYLK